MPIWNEWMLIELTPVFWNELFEYARPPVYLDPSTFEWSQIVISITTKLMTPGNEWLHNADT